MVALFLLMFFRGILSFRNLSLIQQKAIVNREHIRLVNIVYGWTATENSSVFIAVDKSLKFSLLVEVQIVFA